MKNNKKIALFSGIILVVLTVTVCAWYLFPDNENGTRKEIEVMSPYFLYLLNPGDTNSLQFAVGNLHPGEVKRTVICVSNKKPDDLAGTVVDIARDSDFNYELELINTNNLEVNYSLYQVEAKSLADDYELQTDEYVFDEVPGVYFRKAGTKLNGVDMTAERRESVLGNNGDDVINGGTYTLFSKYEDESKMHLSYTASENKYDFNYYMIEIEWKEDVRFEDNSKETDLLYVVVNAMQPKPEIDTN